MREGRRGCKERGPANVQEDMLGPQPSPLRMKLTQMFFKLALVVSSQKQRFKNRRCRILGLEGIYVQGSVKCKGHGCETFAGLGSGPAGSLLVR